MNPALVWHLTRQDLIDRYAGSMLGGLWTFIQPLVNMLVFILVFSQIMQARLPQATGAHSYSIYLISGLLGWIAFASTLMRTTTVFLDHAATIKKIRVALPSFPLAILISDSIVFVISYGFFLLFLLLVQHPLTQSLLWIPLIFALQQAFAATLGLVLGTLSVFFRDIKEAVGVVLQLWFWLTPIVYVIDIIPESMAALMTWNPMFPIIDAYHHVVLLGSAPELSDLSLLLVGIAVLGILGVWMLSRLESDIRDMI